MGIEAWVKSVPPWKKIFHACFCQVVKGTANPESLYVLGLSFFLTHSYEALLPVTTGQDLDKGILVVFFLLVAFFQVSHFSTSPTGNSSFIWGSSIQPPCPLRLQASAPVLCIWLGHQQWTDVPMQTLAPAGIFQEWNFLFVSDNSLPFLTTSSRL